MPDFDSFLDETLEAWRDMRGGLIDEVTNLPAARFDFRPTPETRSVKELVQHVLEIAMFMTEEITRPDTDLTRVPWEELPTRYASRAYAAETKEELIALLESQMDEAEQKFRSAGELALWQFMERFDGKQGTKMQWWHHGIAQVAYHRGQLATYARLLGLPPALTKRLTGE